ncbi:hypothetical protein XBLMG947_1758 [Xanthomonas bromi]|uniref:Uncharacterized protein n=1 Tax=Xanthomonas bromi TaxID=56449 RepID=A0A1C3NKR1_9XANT|nr:hypothetical protein XBLMG947_1758 [Xanthomonas bromi]
MDGFTGCPASGKGSAPSTDPALAPSSEPTTRDWQTRCVCRKTSASQVMGHADRPPISPT